MQPAAVWKELTSNDRWKAVSILIAISFLPYCMHGQSPFFKRHLLGEDYVHVTPERIYQDRQSLLWFGTTDGLFQYDGLDFWPKQKQDSTSNHVTAIYQDRHNRIWTGYKDGSIYYLDKGQLKPWILEEGHPTVPIVDFAEDGAGNFWFATYGEGVYYFKDHRLYNIDQEDGLAGDDIYVMVPDQQGRMWLGTDGGINICSLNGTEHEVVTISTDDGLPDNIVRELLPDQKGNFWVGMYDGGFCYYDVSAKTFSQPISKWTLGSVGHLELFEGRELWIGTERNGIWRYCFFDKTLHQVDAGQAMQFAKINDLLKGIEGNIWVISNVFGIMHANRQFEFVPTTFENIQAVLTDQYNTLWIGTENGLFTQHLDKHGNSIFKRHLPDLPLNVISLFEDWYGNLWIGTFGDGVYVLNPKNGSVRHISEKDGLENGSILSMDGRNGKVWLATLAGAIELEIASDPIRDKILVHHNFSRQNGLKTNYIYKVFIDSKGRTWFGTDGMGISVLDNGKITNYQKAQHDHAGQHSEDGPDLRQIFSITEDLRGHIWLSTGKEGIFEFDGQEFRHLALKEGIRSMAITSLITTKNGDILIVHPTGVDLLTPETHHLIYYDSEVGIENLSPNLNTVCADKDGQVWIGSKGKLIRYTPLNENLSIHPRTVLNSVSVFLETVDHHQLHTFDHHQNNLVFNYIGIWYTDPATVQYRYMLEGFDNDWRISKDREANYPNLPPGKYTFKVTSTENAAFHDEPVVTYAFEVLAPLWMRPWFIALSIAGAATLLFWYIKEREKRINRVATLKKEKIESQFEALKSQINPHFLFNSFNTLISIIEEDPEMAVKYVENLSDFYRSILQYREKEVITLEEECKVVENYTYLLRHRFGDNLQLDIQLNQDAINTYVAPLTLQMLVENAVKHNVISKRNPLDIQIHMNGGGFIVVENSLQPKIDKLKSTHFGLQNIITRYELLSTKKVKIEKTEDRFKVSIPIISSTT